jgi:hypothetical protein
MKCQHKYKTLGIFLEQKGREVGIKKLISVGGYKDVVLIQCIKCKEVFRA